MTENPTNTPMTTCKGMTLRNVPSLHCHGPSLYAALFQCTDITFSASFVTLVRISGRPSGLSKMAQDKDEVMKDAEPVDKDDKKQDKKKLKKGEVDKDAELSDEDLELKNNLLMMVERISKESDPGLQARSLNPRKKVIRRLTYKSTKCLSGKRGCQTLHRVDLDFLFKSADSRASNALLVVPHQ
jgi:hypothetical protein